MQLSGNVNLEYWICMIFITILNIYISKNFKNKTLHFIFLVCVDIGVNCISLAFISIVIGTFPVSTLWYDVWCGYPFYPFIHLFFILFNFYLNIDVIITINKEKGYLYRKKK